MNALVLPVVQFARYLFEDDDEDDLVEVDEKIYNFEEVTVINMNDRQLQIYFRLTPTSFEDLLSKSQNILYNMNLNPSNVGHPRTLLSKELMITIWYLGNLESLRSVANRFGVAKSSCWDILYRTCKLLLSVNTEYKIIVWPNEDRQNEIANSFNSHGFAGVIGCIDGSHIRILPPKVNRNYYINRKNYPSILLQGVCDNNKLFLDVYAGEVGSMHDYTLFKKSDLYAGIRDGSVIFHNNNYLLGDLAYKLSQYLMVGFKNHGHLTPRQIKFNNILSKKRVIIENAFALLKGRFRRLKYMETVKLNLVVLLIMSSCILHNICIHNGDIPEHIMNVDEENHIERGDRPHNFPDIEEEQAAEDANAQRQDIVNALRM